MAVSPSNQLPQLVKTKETMALWMSPFYPLWSKKLLLPVYLMQIYILPRFI